MITPERPTLEDWEKAPPYSEDATGFTRLRQWRKFSDPHSTHFGKWLTKKAPGGKRMWFSVKEEYKK